MYTGSSVRLTADFSSELCRDERNWDDIFKVLKEKYYQARILYPAKPLFKIREEIKTFLDKNERTHHQQI